MFEVDLASANPEKEAALTAKIAASGGWLDSREEYDPPKWTVCSTYEFKDLSQAELMMANLRRNGEYVEGPSLYSD